MRDETARRHVLTAAIFHELRREAREEAREKGQEEAEAAEYCQKKREKKVVPNDPSCLNCTATLLRGW